MTVILNTKKIINIFKKGAMFSLHMPQIYNAVLGKTKVDFRLRELIMYSISRVNNAPYCLFIHSYLAKRANVTDNEMYGDFSSLSLKEKSALSYAFRSIGTQEPDDLINAPAPSEFFSAEELSSIRIVAEMIQYANDLNSFSPKF